MPEENTAEIDSTINDEDVTIEEEVETPVQPKKNKSNVAKILEQRNAYKRELEELRQSQTKSTSLEKKLEALEEMVAGQTLAKETELEKIKFFTANPKAKEFEEGINAVKESYDLPYEDAMNLYLAKNKPELLADEQFRNKSTASMGAVEGTPENPIESKGNDPREMSPEEFMKWSDSMASNTGGFELSK